MCDLKAPSLLALYLQEVVLMGWVHEQLPSAAHTKVWQRKVLVLRKLQLQIFSSALVGQTLYPHSQGLHIACQLLYRKAGLGNVKLGLYNSLCYINSHIEMKGSVITGQRLYTWYKGLTINRLTSSERLKVHPEIVFTVCVVLTITVDTVAMYTNYRKQCRSGIGQRRAINCSK